MTSGAFGFFRTHSNCGGKKPTSPNASYEVCLVDILWPKISFSLCFGKIINMMLKISFSVFSLKIDTCSFYL